MVGYCISFRKTDDIKSPDILVQNTNLKMTEKKKAAPDGTAFLLQWDLLQRHFQRDNDISAGGTDTTAKGAVMQIQYIFYSKRGRNIF